MKVIFIITFPPVYDYFKTVEPDHSWVSGKGAIIGVWRQDWGHVFAKEVKRFFPDVEFEVWRPDYRAEKEYVHVFDDGVVHRTFPSRKVKFMTGLKPAYFDTSNELIEKFGQTIHKHKDTRDMICHIPLDFSYLGFVLLKKYRKKIPFLHTSHLNPDLLNVNLRTLNPLKFFHRLFIKQTYDQHKRLLGDIAVLSDKIEFFKKYINSNVYQLDSLNFDFKWAERKISKVEARKRVNLNTNVFILFSSSRLVPEKQLDKMIQSLAKLKNHTFLCIISGSGELRYQDELKELVTRLELVKHVSFVGYLSDKLIEYYCASDVFISTSVSEAGPVSAIKAMALDIPVISTDTGIVFSILKESNAGLILDRKDPANWAKQIEKVILGEKVKAVDSKKLAEDYDVKKSIQQLLSYYKKAIEKFWAKQTVVSSAE